MTLLELAERCEQATGPDRELDVEIPAKRLTAGWAHPTGCPFPHHPLLEGTGD